jgi:DNA-binding LytR/AlgR family response regulator
MSSRVNAYIKGIEMNKKPQWNSPSSRALDDEVIPIRRAGRLIPVAGSQVRWVKADGDYVQLHTPTGSFLVREPLKNLAERWSEHGFMRIHRCYLVFFPLITDVWQGPSGCNIRLGSGPSAVDLPVSRQHKHEVEQRWIQHPET